jgi:signal transduction histidine kinase
MGPGAATDLTLEGLIHDLNNVFATISEAADLLQQDEKWSRVAAAIRRSANRGRRLVDSLSASALALQDFDAILNNAMEFARDFLGAARAPRLEFSRNVEPGIHLKGSTGAWERVLVNLFVNAAQAMERGGVVEISARRKEQGVEICVADSGPGIAPEILPQIFKPRFSTKSPRSGLGLHIVKSIVTQYGGTVSACNRNDAPGAVFCIRLPEG